MWRLVLCVILALIGLSLVFASYACRAVYPAPPVAVPSPPPEPLEEVRLDLPAEVARGGAWVHAWAQAPPGLASDSPVALFFHGNGENLETVRRSGLFEELRVLGVLVVAADYPGYGRSPGKPREEGVLATGDAAFRWVRSRYPERPLVLVGWSLGAAVAIETAARHPDETAGLVVMSSWTSLPEVARVHFPAVLVRWGVRERYDSRGAAHRLAGRGVPALVIHGERDRIVPAEQGRRIAEALSGSASAPVRWVAVPGVGHNDLLAHRHVWQELERFLAGLSS